MNGYPFVFNLTSEEPALPQIIRLGIQILVWGAAIAWIVKVVRAR